MGQPAGWQQNARRSEQAEAGRSVVTQDRSGSASRAEQSKRSFHDLRFAGHAGFFFRLEIVPGRRVVAADHSDRIGAFFERNEGVDFGRLRHDGNVARIQAAIVDGLKVGKAFLAAIVFAFIDRVIEAALVDRERFPNPVIVRRDALALRKLIQRDDELSS